MSEFARSRAMHQFYRDVFTRIIYLPEADVMPAHIVAEIFNFTSGGIDALEPMIRKAQTELDSDKDTALKNMLCAITMANQALDARNQGFQRQFPAEVSARITENIVSALQLDSNINYLVAAIQVLFRVNEVSSALFLISNNLSLVSDSGPVLKILLLICLMEEDYNQAQVVIQALTTDSSLIGEDQMALLMIVCGIYKLGGVPDSYIDFRPLSAVDYTPDASRYEWLLEKTSGGKTTVLTACDKNILRARAAADLLHLRTNRDELDVHLHLYNADEEVRQHVLALHQQLPELHISASLEEVPAGPGMNVHYACRRFIFLSHAIEHFETPVIALDADLLVRKSWSQVHARCTPAPLILLENDSRPFWEDVIGGFIYAEPGGLTAKYFAAVARFIDINLQSGNAIWFLDQVALTAALDVLPSLEQMAVGREPKSLLLDLNHEGDVFAWVVTTQKNADGAYKDFKNALIEKYQR